MLNAGLKAHWKRLRAGKQDALFSLYHALYFHLMRYGLSVCGDDELTKDCINQLFLKLWERRTKLGEVDDVRAYLFTALRRGIIDELSYSQRLDKALIHKLERDPDSDLSYEEILIRVEKDAEMKKKIEFALKQLTPRQLELVKLRFYEGLSYQEISKKFNHSVKTSYNIIYEAIKSLKKILK